MNLRQIVHKNKDLVYHVLHRMVPDRECHEEIFQDVFLNVLQGLPRFRHEAKFSTWIYTIAVRTCLAHRKNDCRNQNDSLEQCLERNGWQPEAESRVDSAETRLLRRDLEYLLNQLPLKYRLPLVLFYLEGQGYNEIGQILDSPVGTVKTNIYRGLREMRKQLGGVLNDHI